MGSQTPTIMPRHSPVSETARERETFKYDALEACFPPGTASPEGPDAGLAAFAQLGLYRLDAAHCLISLFDRSRQHVIARASRDGQKDTENTAFPRAQGVCERVLLLPSTDPSRPPVSVIPDLSSDSRYRHLVDSLGHFYAGVPIQSPKGIPIGVYCVYDPRPRPDGLREDEVRFLQEISLTVMGHLEFKRSNRRCRREDRLVQGLGRFVEGKEALSGPVESSGHMVPFAAVRGPEQEPVSTQYFDRSNLRRPAMTNRTQSAAPSCTIPRARSGTAHASPADILQREVERVFSKAANIMRESIAIDGVLFLDATVRSFGGLVDQDSAPPVLARTTSSRKVATGVDVIDTVLCPLSSQEEPSCDVLGFSTHTTSSLAGDAPAGDHTSLPERFLRSLLRRYPRGHVFHFEADGSPSDGTLTDEDDTTPHSPLRTTTSLHKSDTTSPSEAGISSSVSEIFPGARSVAFVPLWDAQRNRWFSGGFVWTNTLVRGFSAENELGYLKVFGLAIMSEIARLTTKAADKTKTDVLGSISHELRSPLHGVVGAVEMLRDTALDAFQEGVVSNIETSGRTLLDTIDHLLDYTQTKNILRVSHGDQRAVASLRRRADSSPSISPIPEFPVQLDLLVEEVVDSVLAGHSFWNMSVSDPKLTAWSTATSASRHALHTQGASCPPSLLSSPRAQSPERPEAEVQVHLDIDPSLDWSYRTHPGAFRRIVMNLFGNSLKFTEAGSITVSLCQDGNGDDGQARVRLTVADTGKGISEGYLRSDIFTPFSQEDHFVPGTGLGLSVVRQMTSVLGGSIEVSSHVGEGTTVVVSLPLARCEQLDSQESDFRQDIQTLAGQRVLIRDAFSPHDREPLHVTERICRDWLRMEVVSSGNANPDFVISGAENFLSADENTLDIATCPHIFLCKNSAIAREMCKLCRSSSRTGLAFVTQPVGPRKLASSLLRSQARWKDSPAPATDSASSEQTLEDPSEPASPPPGQAVAASWQTKAIGPAESETDGSGPRFSPAVFPPVIVDAQLPANVAEALEEQHTPEETPSREAVASPLSLPPPERPRPLPIQTAFGRTVSVNVTPARPSILIVDDNPINIKILSAYMSKLQHPFTAAVNGLEAVELYTKSPSQFRCVLTDISMPVMDGLESTRRIRTFERDCDLPPAIVIALTGLGGADVRQEAFASGVDLLLTRPLLLKGLVGALESTGLR